ncbi:unnamed protein product [Musa acuminata subsp. malaccensis]|uniref:Dihydroorotate dehydrogenase (quinone), mitochondrial n=1 Tax=Musa acuminata subsp. malaccensis TaxID=214687 RepID=A0A8D7AZQ6_MUSAM|nr:unnamed protein product [Musa acuminata subsp. malaccensis]
MCIAETMAYCAVINRCGFNSEGIVVVAKRLGAQHAGSGILGVNIGNNKTIEDAVSDYVKGVHTLSQFADYLVINISSLNTPGLCKLQGRKQLEELVKKDIAAVALALHLDGLIISNTTISRPDPVTSHPLAGESGGLSGKPLFDMSTSILKEMYILTQGKIPLIGCGGVSNGEDAYKKIRAGATLVQLYTAFAYDGPSLIPQIKAELAECLERDGFKSVQEAVGADCK